MSVNLATKYVPVLDQRFQQRSLTEPFVGINYSWEGANAIKVWTLESAELNDYDSTATANRFGTPSEVDDEVNVYTLQQKRSFSKVFDITHNHDQEFSKQSNAYLKQMWDERYVPEIDKYRLQVWAKGAGLGKVGESLTKDTVMEALLKAHAALDEANVPQENRVTFIRTDIAVQCKLAAELAFSPNWVNKAIVSGKIAEINGSPVVSVPSVRMPEGVEFMVKYKSATADPVKLKMLRANDAAPGYAGTLMEGLVRYDAFVMAQKADGIYVYSTTGTEAPEITQSGNSVTVTVPEGAVVKYTTDGTNPKVSDMVKVYSGPIPITENARIRAYAEKEGALCSAIASFDAVYGEG